MEMRKGEFTDRFHHLARGVGIGQLDIRPFALRQLCHAADLDFLRADGTALGLLVQRHFDRKVELHEDRSVVFRPAAALWIRDLVEHVEQVVFVGSTHEGRGEVRPAYEVEGHLSSSCVCVGRNR
ncbi:MAG: hypothetical protein V2A73_03635 [Pseudomonadota bacterium]